MLAKLKQLLEYLENSIDQQRLTEAEELHRATLCWEEVPRLPIIACYPYPHDAQFQPFPHGEVFDNPEKMLFNQLVHAFDTSVFLREQVGDDLPISIRADFGCVLIASMFGAHVEQVENNPPWIRHDHDGISYESILSKTSDDFVMERIARVASCYEFYGAVLANYPRLAAVTNLTLPDLQGPFDNMELIRGSDVFLDIQTDTETFLQAMRAVTVTQIEVAQYLQPLTTERTPGLTHQHAFAVKGGTLIRNDTAIMVSPEMYRTMIAPFDEQVLRELGGGIHSCGDVGHVLPEYFALPSIACFDFGQSEMNDVKAAYTLAQAKKIPLIRVAASQDDLISGRILQEYPTGMSLIFRAESFEQARDVIAQYKNHAYRAC